MCNSFASLFLGEVNPGYVNEAQSVAGSRKSLSLRPVLLVAPPEQDRYSELSRAKSHSHHSLYTPAPTHPAHTMSTNTLNHSQHNFQLQIPRRSLTLSLLYILLFIYQKIHKYLFLLFFLLLLYHDNPTNYKKTKKQIL